MNCKFYIKFSFNFSKTSAGVKLFWIEISLSLLVPPVSNVTTLNKWDRQIMQAKLAIKKYATTPETWFGLEYSEVKHETVPLLIGLTRKTWLKERKKITEKSP